MPDIRNPNGSFMSPDEIVADLLTKTYDDETTEAILNDFCPPPGADRIERVVIAMAYSEFTRWIRNVYGLWHDANPYTVNNPPPNSQGIIDHPLFPDNLSGMIMDKFAAAFRQQQSKKGHFVLDDC